MQAVCDPRIYGPPDDARFAPGVLSADAGRAAYETICAAVRDAIDGRVAADRDGARQQARLFARRATVERAYGSAGAPDARAACRDDVLVGIVEGRARDGPRSAVCGPRLLTPDLLRDIVDLTARELPRFGVTRPRLALAGLNPHAGEDGLLGPEDEAVLRPAVQDARSRGIDIQGPFPGDTIFGRAARGEFDAVIACYHDQGLIPVKLLAFGRSVNVTLGLPIIRTSVDHGTAFDIAGKDIADPSSMIEAVLLAARLSKPQGQPSGS